MSKGEDRRFLIRATEIEKLPERKIGHPLNPQSEIYLRSLSDIVGLERVILRLGRVPPGKESFIYHAHHYEEEFVYILSGRGIAEIDEKELEVGTGDFLGFPTPSVAHHLRNPFDIDLIYLMGGERKEVEIGDFPRLGKQVIRDGDRAYIIDINSQEPFLPRQED